MNCEFPNMKTIKITCVLLCVALLPSIIQGSGSGDRVSDSDYESNSIEEEPFAPLHETQAKVDEIMENDGTINNIFKPLQFLGSGSFSVTYRGELGRSKKIVAMKISPISMALGDPVDEYLMYTYMNAINNTAVERYGVPAVYYYYADWEGCTLLAITLLEPQFNQLINTPNVRLEDLDVLIIMREFVRITKYIHSCGVCQDDPHLDNMMFRKNQGFIIDFNWPKKIEADPDCRKEDWRRFLIKVCSVCRFPKDNVINTLKNIANMKSTDGLRLVLMKFVKHAFKTEDAEPINYNQMHRIITQEIRRRGVREPALVSWLTDAQKNEVIAEWSRRQTPAIEDIAEPIERYTYPELNVAYFDDFE